LSSHNNAAAQKADIFTETTTPATEAAPVAPATGDVPAAPVAAQPASDVPASAESKPTSDVPN
jgi:hypothetical protein